MRNNVNVLFTRVDGNALVSSGFFGATFLRLVPPRDTTGLYVTTVDTVDSHAERKGERFSTAQRRSEEHSSF